jgi:hypothetical protein
MFCKQANFELQTRVPLLIRAPWLAAPATGRGSRALVELVDLLPTAIDLTGLRAGGVDISIDGPLGLEGFSLAPLLAEQPPPAAAWKRAAFSQYPRCMNSTIAQQPPYLATRDTCTGGDANQVTHMGYSMRTATWRYAEWPAWKCYGLDGNGPNSCSNVNSTGAAWSGAADWTNLAGRELYSHAGDDGSCFDCYENENVVDDPLHAALVEVLSAQLRAGWRAAAPQHARAGRET